MSAFPKSSLVEAVSQIQETMGPVATQLSWADESMSPIAALASQIQETIGPVATQLSWADESMSPNRGASFSDPRDHWPCRDPAVVG